MAGMTRESGIYRTFAFCSHLFALYSRLFTHYSHIVHSIFTLIHTLFARRNPIRGSMTLLTNVTDVRVDDSHIIGAQVRQGTPSPPRMTRASEIYRTFGISFELVRGYSHIIRGYSHIIHTLFTAHSRLFAIIRTASREHTQPIHAYSHIFTHVHTGSHM